MTEADLKFYKLLKAQIRYKFFAYLTAVFLLLANAYYNLTSHISSELSVVFALCVAVNALSSFFRETSDEKAARIIGELINKDPELVAKLGSMRGS